MADKTEDFYVEVVDKNYQTNIEDDLGIKPEDNKNKAIGQNQFLQNSDQQEYNNKPSTPLERKQQPQNNQDDQEQQSDEQPTYKLDKVLPKQNQKERLIQQNIKLKAQIYELAKQLDEILQKDRGRKKKFGLNIIEEEDQIIREKRLQSKKQQIQIMDLKNKIFVTKRQLETVYNNFVATEKQNLIKKLHAQLKQLERQKDGIANINNQQNKVLKIAQNQEEYGDKLESTKKQYQKIKTQTRKMVVKIQQQQKKLKKTHQTYIDKLSQLKQIQSKLSLNKQKSKLAKKSSSQSQPAFQAISQDMIKTLEAQVKEMEIKKKQGEKQWQEKIKNIDIELYKKRIEEEKKMLILREKQKELKLNELRIRQLRKMMRENDQAEKDKKNKDVDMSQYRHKRNIRYIEK